MPPHPIPERSWSRYPGHYSGSGTPDRLLEIFADSERLALSSKDPGTAQTRFELAVEVYHQLMTMRLSEDQRAAISQRMASLADRFPSTVCLNEARGHLARAEKFKTVPKQLDSLRAAAAALQRGLELRDVGEEELRAMLTATLAAIAERGGGSTPHP